MLFFFFLENANCVPKLTLGATKMNQATPLFQNIHIKMTLKAVTRDKEGYYIVIKGSSKKRHNNCKYKFTKLRSTSIYKANDKSYKRRNQQ